MSFQKVVKQESIQLVEQESFRTVSFQKVVKRLITIGARPASFRTVSFQKVVKLFFWSLILLDRF